MQFDPEMFGQAMGEAIVRAVAPLKEDIARLRKEIEDSKQREEKLAQLVQAEAAKVAQLSDELTVDVGQMAAKAAELVNADLGRWKSSLVESITAPDLPDIQGLVNAAVEKAVSGLPPPRDGKSFTLDDAQPVIEQVANKIAADAQASVTKAVEAAESAVMAVSKAMDGLRQPADGKSVSVDDVAPLIREEVRKAVSAIPTPKDGVGVAGAMIDRDDCLLLTLTNGEVKNLGRVVGADGLSMESFDLEYLAESHEVCIRASAAGRTKELRYPAGGIRPAGYWRDGKQAKAGEAWVHDGSLWIAVKETSDKPDTQSESWIIAARKGRDGERGPKGVDGAPPAPIPVKG